MYLNAYIYILMTTPLINCRLGLKYSPIAGSCYRFVSVKDEGLLHSNLATSYVLKYLYTVDALDLHHVILERMSSSTNNDVS